MKKIPTLFERRFENHRLVGNADEPRGHDCTAGAKPGTGACTLGRAGVVEVLPQVTPGMEWVLEGEGDATVKIDGSCCAIIGGIFYKRYDARRGKDIPKDAIPCDEMDLITGHWPFWVPVDPLDPADKWYCEAFRNSLSLEDGTYEAIGPHFQGNPHRWKVDTLIRHGTMRVNVHRSYEGIREYLQSNVIEGLVFWRDGEPQCKIKRSDFGFDWPVEEDAHG